MQTIPPSPVSAAVSCWRANGEIPSCWKASGEFPPDGLGFSASPPPMTTLASGSVTGALFELMGPMLCTVLPAGDTVSNSDRDCAIASMTSPRLRSLCVNCRSSPIAVPAHVRQTTTRLSKPAVEESGRAMLQTLPAEPAKRTPSTSAPLRLVRTVCDSVRNLIPMETALARSKRPCNTWVAESDSFHADGGYPNSVSIAGVSRQ
jgi:hypothetical protein